MPYIITGTVTFSNQANRDAARTRVLSALSSYTYSNITTVFTPGINNPNNTTMTFSLLDGEDGENAYAIGQAILNAIVAGTRHTAGFVAVSKVP